MTSTEIIAYWMEALHLSTHSFAQLVGVPESTIRMRIKRSTFTTFDEMCRYGVSPGTVPNGIYRRNRPSGT